MGAVVAVAGFLVFAAFLGLSSVSGVGKGEVNAVENAVRVSDAIQTEFESVCEDAETRFVVSVFEGDNLVPCLKQKGTDHWENDFKAFQAAIKTCTDLSQQNIAFGVYNLPVWDSDEHHTFTTYPTFIDFVGADVDMADIYWAGTYLGATKLAAGCTSTAVKILATDTATSLCEKMGADDEDMLSRCESVELIDCPYTTDEAETNPCNVKACKDATDGQDFGTLSGSYGDVCCDAINAWCKKDDINEATKKGCGNFAHKRIYTNHCIGSYVEPVNDAVELHPVLVAETLRVAEEAAAAAAAAAEAQAEADEVARLVALDLEIAAQKVIDDAAAALAAAVPAPAPAPAR